MLILDRKKLYTDAWLLKLGYLSLKPKNLVIQCMVMGLKLKQPNFITHAVISASYFSNSALRTFF